MGSSLLCGLILGAASSTGILYLLLIGPVSYALCTVYMNIIRTKKAELEDLGKGLNAFFNNFILGLLIQVFTFLWSLLFVIPGIIAQYSYAMAFYIQNDHPEMSETDAIKASKEMMRGHKWDLFVFDLSYLGWFILGGLTFGLLFLYIIPYYTAAKAAWYENLLQEQQAENGAATASEAQPEQAQAEGSAPEAGETAEADEIVDAPEAGEQASDDQDKPEEA